MSRSITIGYQLERGGETTYVEIQSPYDLFGTQNASLKFWSLPLWESIGVTRLGQLGHSDPIFFYGWEMMDNLADEIRLIHDHASRLDSCPEEIARNIAHLAYCYHLLRATAPSEAIPCLTIG